MMHPRAPFAFSGSPRRQHGSIIVMVLVFVVLLTFIVVAFLEEATSRIKYYGLFHNRDDLRVDAYSALEISLAIINQYREVEGALWGPEQGWSNPLDTFGFTPANARTVRVSFEDESAKLPLATIEYDTLIALFDLLDFDLPDAQALADGLLDWMDEDDARRLNGFDGEDYQDMRPPYRPANRPVQTWDEFRLIRPFNTLFFDEEGRPLPVWRQFREAVSLYHTGVPNINHAPDVVLELLETRGLLSRRALLDYRNGADGIPGTEDDRLLRELDSGIVMGEAADFSTEIQLLRIKVEAIRGEARFELEALVTWSGSDAGAAATRAVGNRPAGQDERAGNRPGAAVRRTGPTARTLPGVAAELGYPFRFVRLAENRKF
jgi:general secretion pathway protein K